MKYFYTFLALVLCFGIAQAKTLKPIQFEDGEPVRLQGDYAYLVARVAGPLQGMVLVRSLAPEELKAAAEQFAKDGHYPDGPNWVVLDERYAYSKINGENTYVAAVQPGTYVVVRYATGISLCLGTVKFEAKVGVLTDIGTFLVARDDKPTTFPELAGVVRGTRFSEDHLLWKITVRPPTQSMVVPAPLMSLPRALADYHAMGKFPNYFGSVIERMAPVPGVLDYDKDGNVIDSKAVAPVSTQQ